VSLSGTAPHPGCSPCSSSAQHRGFPGGGCRYQQVTVSCVTNSPDVEASPLPCRHRGGAAPARPSSTAPPSARKPPAESPPPCPPRHRHARCPVSGGDVGATAGTPRHHGRRRSRSVRALPARPPCHGQDHVHVGPSGAGQVVKLCNQVAGGLNLLAMAEAISLAAAGVDPAKMLEVVGAGAPVPGCSRTSPRVPSAATSPRLYGRPEQKDLHLVLDEAPGATRRSRDRPRQPALQAVQAQGRGTDGTQSIVDALARLSGDN